MATGSRTLKLSILADVDQLNKSLKAANGDVEDSSNKMMDFGKKAGLAFAAAAAAAGAYAIKIGIDGVKAAIADEASQSKLAQTLGSVTGATNEQITAVEKQITKLQLATGVADDVLRPALARLTLSTGDTAKAQELLSVALDISKARSIPLETVANALSKSYDGNAASLAKLGVGLSAAELKTMSFTEQQTYLTDLFGGAAAKNAETFQGRMDRLTQTVNEAKESIGYALLPILEKLIGYFTQYVLPIVEKISNSFSGDKGGMSEGIINLGNTIQRIFLPIWDGLVKAFGYVKDAIGDNMDSFMAFGKLIAEYVAPVIGTVLGKALEIVGKIAGGVINVIGDIIGAITAAVQGAISLVNWLISKYNSIPLLPNLPLIPTGGAPDVSIPKVSTSGSVTSTSLPSVPVPSGAGSVPSSVGSSAGAASTAASGISSNIGVGGISGYAQALNSMAGGNAAPYTSGYATAITVNMGVVGDPEAAARVIVDTVNNSSYRGTGGANNFVLVS